MKSSKQWIWVMSIVIVVGLVVLLSVSIDKRASSLNESKEKEIPGDWKSLKLVDAENEEEFSLETYQGKKVLVEAFAVWCPVCTRQQQEIQKLHEELGDTFISLSLDVDPNEDAAKVRAYRAQHGFSWRFAVASPDFTRALIAAFGNDVVNAPSAPVVLLCEDGRARKLSSGVKSTEKLKAELAQGC